MISNQQQYNLNTAPLTVVAQVLYYENEFRIVDCQSKKHLLHSDVAEPASKKRKLRQTKVRFSEESNQVAVKVATIEELRSTWYQQREIAGFKQDSKNSIYELYRAQGDLSNMSPDHCIRGLEHVVTPKAAMAQKRIRRERVTAVLFQQQLQRETATRNPELLKLVSSMFSQPRCEEAARMGARDCLVWSDEQC